MTKAEKFLQIEKKSDLFDYKYKGVHLWTLIRVDICSLFFAELDIERIHPDVRKKTLLGSIRNVILILAKIPKYLYHRCCMQSKDVFCSTNNVYKKSMGKIIDPYADFFSDTNLTVHNHTLYNPAKTVGILYSGTNDSTCRIREFVFIVWYKLTRSLGVTKKSKEIVQFLEQVEKTLDIQLDDNYESKVAIKANRFLIRKKYYKKMLKNRFKCIVHGFNYWHAGMALISAAKELGVPTMELQHGLADKNHVAYNFLDSSLENDYFPDFFFTWGDYWSDSVRLPSGSKALSVGFPLMDDSRKSLKDVQQNENTIIFYSSQVREFIMMALSVCDKLTDLGLKVKLKLHPGECKSWKTHYPELNDAKLEVLDKPVNVHELMASAKYHVGIGSTVMYEALAFSGTVLIYDHPYSFLMDDLIEKGYVQLFKEDESLINLITENQIDQNYEDICSQLFKQNATRNIEEAIRAIIG